MNEQAKKRVDAEVEKLRKLEQAKKELRGLFNKYDK